MLIVGLHVSQESREWAPLFLFAYSGLSVTNWLKHSSHLFALTLLMTLLQPSNLSLDDSAQCFSL